MKDVELIYPYTIVEEDGLYGITDRNGNLKVPCVMDEIINGKDDEVGLSYWMDFNSVVICKDGKYGFFTANGKFIEPVYEDYAIDPCGGSIHVKTDEGYGVFKSPKYVFEPLLAEYSLLTEIYGEDFELDFDKDLMTWYEMGIENNTVSAIKEKLHAIGYAYAQDLWDSTYKGNGESCIEKFASDILHDVDFSTMIDEQLEEIKAQCEGYEREFWKVAASYDKYAWLYLWCGDMAKRGAVSFVTLKSMPHANIPLLNSKVSELLKNDGDNGYYSTFRLIDRLLPCPEHGSSEIIPVKFPAGNRPSCKYVNVIFDEEISGEIGEIYLCEHSMHMYNVCVNLYDSEYTDGCMDENHILDISDIVLSELLTCLQQVIDPAKENTELSAAIDNALKVEKGKSPMAQILKDCGIYLLSLSDFGRTPRFYDGKIAEDVDYVYVVEDEVKLVLDSNTFDVNTVTLNEGCGNYSWIVEDIKAAANTAYKKSKH